MNNKRGTHFQDTLTRDIDLQTCRSQDVLENERCICVEVRFVCVIHLQFQDTLTSDIDLQTCRSQDVLKNERCIRVEVRFVCVIRLQFQDTLTNDLATSLKCLESN